jgi:16S rRNA (guanine527-N7)-methyltransferase
MRLRFSGFYKGPAGDKIKLQAIGIDTFGCQGKMMEKGDFPTTLLKLANEHGIPLSHEQSLLCHRHVLVMLEWNLRCNLTRITDLREIIEKHLLDSLIPARWLPRAGRAIDIGTGPGFPGIPLKILHPELEMLLLESHRKKSSFLKIALSRLSLPGISVMQGRWEEFAQTDKPLLKRPFALAIMRAVKLEPQHLAAASSMVLGPDGVFAWWAGPSADPRWCDEHRGIFETTGMSFEGRRSYLLPTTSQPRYLFIWRKRVAGDDAGFEDPTTGFP